MLWSSEGTEEQNLAALCVTRARPPATWEPYPHIALLSSDTGGVRELSVTGAGWLTKGAKLFSQGLLNGGKGGEKEGGKVK